MSRFVFFTKTNWNEAPRLRHQLAFLLKEHEHNLIFFERPNSFFSRKKTLTEPIDQIEFLRTSELMHHKLRFTNGIHVLNAHIEKSYIKKMINQYALSGDDYVVNFNYDYYFLRQLFPNNKIITIINDDFWCCAFFGYEKPLKDVLVKTCSISNTVLAVSEPLVEQLAQFCEPKLFLPWSDFDYSCPNLDSKKYRLLFWGYINNRLNFDYIANLANAILEERLPFILDFIGPMEKNIDKRFISLMSHPKVNVLPKETKISDIDLDNVLAGFIPYVRGNKAVDVTTIPNKTLRMLSFGLPLLITGMPRFMEAPFVFRLEEGLIQRDIELIKLIPKLFSDLQPSISIFVNNNSKKKRYNQFLSYL